MAKLNLHVDFLDSSLSLQKREEKLKQFENGNIWVLITTDVLARGIDFRNLQTVINFDFPSTTVDYIHRVGRTGRAGKSGKALTFFTMSDKIMLQQIAELLKNSGVEVPQWMIDLTPGHKREIKKIEKYGIVRDDIIYDRNSKAGKKSYRQFKQYVKSRDYKFHQSRELLNKRGDSEVVLDEQTPQDENLEEANTQNLENRKSKEMTDEFVPMSKEQLESLGIVVGSNAKSSD